MEGDFANPKNIKCIEGYAYYVGSAREIYKRVDIGKWVRLQKVFQVEKQIPIWDSRILMVFQSKICMPLAVKGMSGT